ncbi:3-oxoacyl-[acyl-carrier-protein] reductase-like isoform X2 [Antedon mediterranea]|uniref:3-oxoacyl-[acyl-carrier-protein] reductase-like isoform X2 n=1 Tax=Antedon mediterranea TaxID=105859 RepID=UPI003AF8881F
MTGVVFGGSGGIGRSIALNLIKNKYNVAILGRNLEKLHEAQDYIECEASDNSETHGSVLPVVCDVTDPSTVKNGLQTVEESFEGNVDVMVNAAGITRDGLLLRTSPDAIEELLHTNLLASIITSQAVLRGMVKRKKGSILNIGSVLGLRGNTGSTVYSATKSGLIGFTKSLAKEVASKNVSVNLIAPGFIRTDMTKSLSEDQFTKTIPLQRFGDPAEVGNVAMFLINSTYITGQVIVVDGGLHLNM